MTTSTSAAGQQLWQCLTQLIAADSTASAAAALDALLEVSWFADLAKVAACDVQVSPDGALTLPHTPQQDTLASGSEPQEQLGHLLAALLAKLSHQHEDLAAHVLQRLLPQLLACQHAASGSSTGRNSWVPVMCRTAAELHATRHRAAQQLAATCVQQIEQHTSAPLSGSSTVGQLACMQLLAGILQPSSPKATAGGGSSGSRHKEGSGTQPAAAAAAAGAGRSRESSGLQPDLLQRLLDCVVPNIASGHPLSKTLQANLIVPLMAAAAATATAEPGISTAASPGYSTACSKLLDAVCGSSSSSQSTPGFDCGSEQQRDGTSSSSSSSGSKVSECLTLMCRLQPHLLLACTASSGQGAKLHRLLLEALLHGDLHCRQQAVHLLQACVAAGCAPKVLSVEQWHSYIMLYQAEEQHMLHLIQPLWAESFTGLWQGSPDSGSNQLPHHQHQQQQEQQELVRWCSVLVLRAAFHPNVGVKRLGLSGFLSTATLQALLTCEKCDTTNSTATPAGSGSLYPVPGSGAEPGPSSSGPGAWPELQELLLQLLPAFADRKLVTLAAGGSASSRQAQAVAALQQQLAGFVCRCIQGLQEACAGGQQQVPQAQCMDVPCVPVQQLLVRYTETASAVGDKAASLLFLLEALADGIASAADGADATDAGAGGASLLLITSSSSSKNKALLQALTRTLAHAQFVHPAYLRPAICRTVLRIVPYCLHPAAVGPSAVLPLLAACSPLVVGSTAAVEQQLLQHSEVFAVGRLLEWLQAALTAAPSPAAAACSNGATLGAATSSSGLRAALLSSGGTAPQQQYAALYCLGMLAPDMGPAVQQEVTGALSAAAAAGRHEEGSDTQQWQQQQQRGGELTGPAWLMAGMLAALAGTASAQDGSNKQPTAAAVVAVAAADVLPVLLQHHLATCSPPHAVSCDPHWCEALVAVVQAAAAAAAAGTSAVLQLQGMLQQELAGWVASLAPWLTAAGDPAVSLQEQLLLLTSAQVACFALQQPGSSCCGQVGLPLLSDDSLDACLQLLCPLTPSTVMSSSTSSTTSGCPLTANSTSSSSSSRMELTDRLLQLHAAVLDQLVIAAAGGGTCGLSLGTRQLVAGRCLQDLEWSCQHTLQHLLHTLLLTAPWPAAAAAQRPAGGHQQDSGVADESLGQLQAMLQQFQPLVRSSSKRFSAAEVQLLAKVFFNPALFSCRELLPTLYQQLVPFALVHGGVRLSVGVMSHVCYGVLGPNPQLLRELLPHITHMAAFSLFSDRVTQAVALQQQKCDVALLLPSRVVLCGFLLQLASSGRHTDFTAQLARGLLSIAQAAPGSPHAWLGAREASQSSCANGIRVAVWQTLCLLAPYLPAEQLPEVLKQGWSCLLCSHQHSNVRPHVQLFLLVLFSRHPAAVHELLLPALNTFNTTSYQVTVSIIILAMFVLLELGPESGQFLPLLHALLPWALHHRHAVRIPVQVMLHVTFERHMPALERSLGVKATELLVQVRRFLVENDELVKLRSRQGLVDLEGFDLVQETSLQGVFGVKQDQLDSLCDGECEGTGLQWPLHVRERLPLDLLSCLPGAVKAVGDKRGPGSAAGGAGADADADAAGAGAATAAAGGDAGGDGADKEDGTDAATAGTMHQLRPQLQGSLFDDTAADRADALVADRAAKLGLILCASLLENLPNLAGLCRTCESMSAEALVVASRAVVQTDAFKKQSRTSERWLRILEVGLQDLATYLQEQRAAGYTIIGIEQASNSVALQSYQFPQHCVVVLGNEQSGMPASVLGLLDVCVEIPMLGVTRSLNAHVSGAMVLWNYTQQHLE